MEEAFLLDNRLMFGFEANKSPITLPTTKNIQQYSFDNHGSTYNTVRLSNLKKHCQAKQICATIVPSFEKGNPNMELTADDPMFTYGFRVSTAKISSIAPTYVLISLELS